MGSGGKVGDPQTFIILNHKKSRRSTLLNEINPFFFDKIASLSLLRTEVVQLLHAADADAGHVEK